MPDETHVISISLDAREMKPGADIAKQAADVVVAAEEKIVQAYKKGTISITEELRKQKEGVKQAADAVGASSAQIEKAADATAKVTARIVTNSNVGGENRFLSGIARDIDPIGVKAQAAADKLERLNKIIADGGMNAVRASEMLGPYEKKLQDLQSLAVGGGGRGGGLPPISPPPSAPPPPTTPPMRAFNVMDQIAAEENALLQENQRLLDQTTQKYGLYVREIELAKDEVERLTAIVKEGGNQSLQANSLLIESEKQLNQVRLQQMAALEKRNTLTTAGTVATKAAPIAANTDDQAEATIIRLSDRTRKYEEAVKAAKTDVDVLYRAINSGGSQSAAAVELLPVAQKKVEEALKAQSAAANDNKLALVGSGEAAEHAAGAHAQMSIQAQSAFHAMRGFTEQVAFGIPITRAATSEINNLTFALSKPGAFKEVFTVIGSLFGQYIALAGAAAVLGGALFILGSRISEVSSNLRGFRIALDTTAKGSGLSAQSFQSIIDDFRKIGVAAADSKASIENIFKAAPQGLNPAFSRQLIQTALDISVTPSGTGKLPEDLNKLIGALTGGVEGLKKYAFELNALSAPEAAEIDRLVQLGKIPDAILLGFNRVSDFFAGKYLQSLTPAQKLTIELANKWHELVDTLSESDFAQGAVKALTALAISITTALKDLDSLVKWFAEHKDIGGAFIDRLTGGGLLKGVLPEKTLAPTGVLSQGVSPLPSGAALAAAQPLGVTPQVAEEWIKELRARGASEEKIQKWLSNLVDAEMKNTEALNKNTDKVPQSELISGGQAGVGPPQARMDIGGPAGAPRLNISPQADVTASNDLRILTQILGKATESLPEGFSAEILSGNRPGARVAGTGGVSQHALADAIDFQIRGPQGVLKPFGADTTGMYQQVEEAVLAAQRTMFPDLGGRLGRGTRFGDAGHIDLGGDRGRQGIPETRIVQTGKPLFDIGTALGGTSTLDTQQKLITSNDALEESFAKLSKRQQENVEISKLEPRAQEVARAAIEARREAEDKLTSQQDPNRAATLAAADANERLNAQWSVQGKIAGEAAEGSLKTADAYRNDEVAGLKAAAAAEARNMELTSTIPFAQAYNQIINKNATDAILGAQKEKTAFELTLAANTRVADATKIGTAAARDAEIQNEAITATHDALAKATLTGNAALIERARILESGKIKQLEANAALLDAIQLEQSIINLKNERQITQAQVAFVGSGLTPDQISAQTALIQAQQLVDQRLSKSPPEIKQQYLDIVRSSEAWKLQLQEVQREQQRINDLVSNLAGTISGELTQAIQDAFDPKKATDWATKIKDAIKGIVSSLAQGLVINPVLGSIAGGLGFGQVAQNLGTVGGIGGNPQTGAVGLPTGSGSLLGTASQGLGLTNSLGGGSLFGTGGISNFINANIGGALGFATPGFGGLTGAELEGLGIPGASGGLFGGSTLTGALGGLGAGVGAGGLISSLLGGNPIAGSAGGAVGGLVGNLLLPGIGGILGGALGGLTGLFGNNRPSNNPAANDLNLTTGQTSRNVSSPDQASNQNVQQITQTLQSFTAQLTQLIGHPLNLQNTTVDIQSGVRDGIKLGFGGSTRAFGDAASAINAIELDIAHGLTNVSASMSTVLAHITDPSQIQDAITFALQYDKLKTAADSAFSSIAADTQQIGPFESALVSIQGTFADLTDKANKFGLSLGPINDGLAEATRRLQVDFGTALDQALNAATANDFINQIKAVGDAFRSNTREASAIGLGEDPTTATKISQVEVAKAREILSQLTPAQLTQVAGQLRDTYPELSELAKTIVGIGDAAGTATSSIEDLTNGIKGISDLAKSLTIGPLAGLTAAQQVTANVTQFNADVGAARRAGAGVTNEQLTNVTTSGQAAIEAAQTAYGNAPATADIRRQIVQDLNSILSIANSAQTNRTAAGTAADFANNIPASVLAAQNVVRANPVSVTTNVPTGVIPAPVSNTATPTAPATPSAPAPTPAASTEKDMFGQPASLGGHQVGDIWYLTADEQGAYVNLKDLGYAGGTKDWTWMHGENDNSPMKAYAKGVVMGYEGGTVAGKIMVGERGPEWMMHRGEKNWMQVGKSGPEVIDQMGGATILPFPVHPKDVEVMGAAKMTPAYATGTTDFDLIPSPPAMIPAPTMEGNIPRTSDSMTGVVFELRELRTENRGLREELGAVKKQIQGGQVQAMQDARVGNSKLSSIDGKLGTGAVAPTRRAVG